MSVLAILAYFFSLFGGELGEAEKAYKKAEAATTIEEEEKMLNLSLEKYLKVEKELFTPSGKLYNQIGNCYFLLEQYPAAILYYFRAGKLLPREEAVFFNLEKALEKSGLSSPPKMKWWLLSSPEILQLFWVCFFSGFLLIWVQRLKKLALIFFVLSFGFLTIASYDRFVAPLEAICMRAVVFKKAPDEKAALVSTEPILGGVKLRVLRIDGEWLKVVSPKGEWGFIPATAARLI